jgi:hypothetical protein
MLHYIIFRREVSKIYMKTLFASGCIKNFQIIVTFSSPNFDIYMSKGDYIIV